MTMLKQLATAPYCASRRGFGGVSTVNEIIKANLERLIECDGRTVTEIARVAFPDRSETAGRKLIERAVKFGWVQEDVAKALPQVFGVELAEFYLPIEPRVRIVDMQRRRFKAAEQAAKSAHREFKATAKSLFDQILNAPSDPECQR